MGTTEGVTEAGAVTKQTTETLMAGEQIIEALELADTECTANKNYEEQKSVNGAALLQPSRNPILAALDLEPEAYVLKVIEKVQSTALQDAILTLPFGKVVSLMGYINIWAYRVRTPNFDLNAVNLGDCRSGTSH